MIELLKVDDLNVALEKLYNECINHDILIASDETFIKDAYNKILAEDVISKIEVPSFDKSTVDGYAVRARDTEGATDTIPTFLKIVGEVNMGDNTNLTINSGECVYVPTGGMIPEGADACVMIENCEKITDDKVAIYESVSVGRHTVKKGDDSKVGDLILKKGKKIKSGDMGLLSSVSIDKVKAYKSWNVTIISTGDELVDSTDKLEKGKIRDVNTNLLIGLCKKYGMNVVNTYLLKDDYKTLETTIVESMQKSDVVVVSGGSSKGKKDVSAFVIDNIADPGILTHGIAIKPGKPTITAVDKKTKTIIIGLPGHPVAAAVLFKLIVVNLYYKLAGGVLEDYCFEGKLIENIPASPGRMTIQLVNADDHFNITPIFGKSGIIRTLANAMGYIVLDKNSEGINKGSIVRVYYL